MIGRHSLNKYLFLCNIWWNTQCHIFSTDASKLAVDADDSSSDDEGAPKISLAEMLEDLNLGGDATGGEGADMIE